MKKEDINKAILDHYSKYNKPPTRKELDEHYGIKRYDVDKYYGSLKSALIELGLIIDINKLRDYNSKEFNFLYQDYINGKTYKELENIYKINETTIIDILKKSNKTMKKNKWTEEQIEKLIRLYPTEDWEDILTELYPFKKKEIHAKASKLKLTRECHGFSSEQEEFLINNYELYTVKQLSEMLGKTESSIVSKANKLGLKRVEKWTDEEIKILKDKYSNHSTTELMQFLPKRNRDTIIDKANSLGLRKDKEYNFYENAITTKELLLEKLINLSKKLRRTPTSQEVNKYLDIGVISYHRYFGSYSNACKEAGLEVNTCLFGKSFHLKSKNGDICLSKKEKEITDLLIDNNIYYEKEVLYKDILKDDSLKNIRCDWFVNNEIVVEYFGMPEKECYKERMGEKISLCKERGLKLIQLENNDLKNNFKGLINKFKEHGIEIKTVV